MQNVLQVRRQSSTASCERATKHLRANQTALSPPKSYAPSTTHRLESFKWNLATESTNQHMEPTVTILLHRMFCYRGTALRRAAGNVAVWRPITLVALQCWDPLNRTLKNSLYDIKGNVVIHPICHYSKNARLIQYRKQGKPCCDVIHKPHTTTVAWCETLGHTNSIAENT